MAIVSAFLEPSYQSYPSYGSIPEAVGDVTARGRLAGVVGSAAIAAWIAQLVFAGLVLYGWARGDVKPKQIAVFLLLWLSSACSVRQGDSQLAAAIDAVRTIDSHAHVVAPDIEHDKDYDALPCDILPAPVGRPPANTRFGPDLQAAWSALYGFSADSD